MPTEVRRITFLPGELVEALGTHLELSAFDASGSSFSFVEGADGERQLQIAAKEPAEKQEQAVRLSAEDVGSALVRYCLDRGVPIPTRTARSLSVNDGNLALFIHMDEEPDVSNVLLPDFFDYDFYG